MKDDEQEAPFCGWRLRQGNILIISLFPFFSRVFHKKEKRIRVSALSATLSEIRVVRYRKSELLDCATV